MQMDDSACTDYLGECTSLLILDISGACFGEAAPPVPPALRFLRFHTDPWPADTSWLNPHEQILQDLIGWLPTKTLGRIWVPASWKADAFFDPFFVHCQTHRIEVELDWHRSEETEEDEAFETRFFDWVEMLETKMEEEASGELQADLRRSFSRWADFRPSQAAVELGSPLYDHEAPGVNLRCTRFFLFSAHFI
jgi:hypothetical protein